MHLFALIIAIALLASWPTSARLEPLAATAGVDRPPSPASGPIDLDTLTPTLRPGHLMQLRKRLMNDF